MSASLLSQAGVKGDDGDVSVRISEKAEFKGFISALGVAHFLGVQFARIPARFRQAQLLPPESHCATVEATEYGPICPQAPDNLRRIRQHLFAGAPAANLAQSEYDCLRLNIYTPKSVISSGNKVPVLLWIHGGGWSIENGNADFSGDFLVHHSIETGKPIVFVSINYRMGSFGFLSSSELAAEAVSHGEAGWANQGLNDQRLGLQWVKDYIYMFGGDGSNVTIAGESAGAWSVLAHLRSNQALCQRGIMQSAPSWSMLGPEEAQAKFDRLVQRAGVPLTATASQKIAALRSASTEDLIAWNGPLTSPIWDPKWFVGHALPEAPLDCVEPFPNWVQAIVTGTMRDEMSVFGFDKLWKTKVSVISSLRNVLSLPSDHSFGSEVLEEYGVLEARSDTAAVQALTSLLADACFSSLPFNVASACSNPNSPSLYIYRFDQSDEEEGSLLNGAAFHTLDNTYLCRYPAVAGYAAPRSCQTTADMFSQMVLRHTYGEPPWQEYSISHAQNVFDGAHTRLETVSRDCQRWRKLLTSQDRMNRFARLFFDFINQGPGQ
ncbi:hypothetical protein V500_02795 [Pseudogymnoascus sp. VKM F-4518 (FW-2643)]|nr:hypothetical protein V500_02795 [Pseudogymnoascus sp. VKM F-4518 (FW-2643)]